MNAGNEFTGYRVEVDFKGDHKVICAYIGDALVAEAWEPNLPTGLWRITVPGSDLPEVTARDKDTAIVWVSYLAGALVARSAA